MDIRYRHITSWIKHSIANFLVIWGMGGIGKTTLARYIVYSNRDEFENICIIEHIGSSWKEPHDLLALQEKLLQGILGVKEIKLANTSQGKSEIEKALQRKKALIVLDDIVELPQLLDLFGTSNINAETKIIVTTRKANVNTWFKSRSWKCFQYEMKPLEFDESLELLCLHAFGTKTPLEGYKELAKRVVEYCGRNPLALEVLGSSLSENIDIESWKSLVKFFGKDLHCDIMKVLRRSYDSLPYSSEKELFLHIACFFDGADMDHVVKIFEHDFAAEATIETLRKRCLLSVSSNRTLMMHPLLQQMGRELVCAESPKNPGKRSRVWQDKESYDLLRKRKGSKNVEGLALDMQILSVQKHTFKASSLETESLKSMGRLKLLYFKFVELSGSYDNFPEDLRSLCWVGFGLNTIPSDLFMGNLVALVMSNSLLTVFELPKDLPSLKILDLKDSYNLLKILKINMIPNIETMILCNCHNLDHVCETIVGLKSLALLNMTGCKNMFKKSWRTMAMNRFKTLIASIGSTQKPSFPLPHSLERLFLKECTLECTDYFPLSFSDQLVLKYLNLGNSVFEFLPSYIHLRDLQVLDLSSCSRLKCLLCLPSTLAELYIHNCVSLEKVTFELHRFTLKKLGYEGCVNLSEIEGIMKLALIADLDEIDLGHMKWLKEYQNHEMCLVGDAELTKNRSQFVQVLYEFGIMSTSLPDIENEKMTPDYVSKSSSLSFDVPLCPTNKKIKGLNVSFKYTISGDDCVWFAKISTTNDVDYMYNPVVFGRPQLNEVGIWLSYWPIGKTLSFRDKVNVSIVVVSGVNVSECGASLVYTDDEVTHDETLENNMGQAKTTEGVFEMNTVEWDLSSFKLSTGAYYLCRRDLFELTEVGKPTPGWFRTLVGDMIDDIEVQGWTKTGRCGHLNSVLSELKTHRRINPAPELETKSPDSSTLHSPESSPAIMATPRDHPTSYDVFLSFGIDTCHSFTDHLYEKLEQAGIHTFRDNDHVISRGKEMKSGIKSAIKASKASIIVLSEDYVTSTSCLDELLLIIEQKEERDHFVLPLFYRVDQSDLKNQDNKFMIKLNTSLDSNINRWKVALTEVAILTGMNVSGSETAFLEDVVDTIYNKLYHKAAYLPPNLVGMVTLDTKITSWLEESGADILVIYGMGGSGKTTLAKHIVNSNWHNFESTSILENIGTTCESQHGLVQLQQKLLRDILQGRKRRMPDVHHSTSEIEELLQKKKTLIVLDDIVEKGQLFAFLGTGNFNEQSKIIITTRDDRIKGWLGFRPHRCQEYKLKPLNDAESLEMLSLHAFGSIDLMEGFEELAEKAKQYCEGNPLAIEVLGSSLSVNNSISFWETTLNSWERDIDCRIEDVLRRSYNSLTRDIEKQLFLEIACFFPGEDMGFFAKISEHDTPVIRSLINSLKSKHLLSVSPNKKLIMHRLHRQMGRNIVYQESPNSPSERSIVWHDIESYQLLREGKGSPKVQGLALDMKMLSQEDEQLESQATELSTDSFGHMVNLKYLRLNWVEFTGSYKNFPESLRWLCWHNLQLSTIPSDLFMGSLVSLDMSYSFLEVFEPPMVIKSLKILNLKSSHVLLEIRNINRLPKLDTLILSNCHKLVSMCKTLGDLQRLALLNIIGCEKLCKISMERSFFLKIKDIISVGGTTKHVFSHLPRSLEQLFVSDCNLEGTNSSVPLSFSGQPFLQYLNLSKGRFEVLPSYNHLKKLRVLDLRFCSKLKSLLCLPSSLSELYVDYCTSLEKITFESHQFTLQEFSYNGCIDLLEVEGYFKLVPIHKLDEADLGHMTWLRDYQSHEVSLVGNDELTRGRNMCLQMLYEFDIMSTSLPEITDLKSISEYISKSPYLCFDVPPCPKNKKIKGLNVASKYIISRNATDDCVWFAKIRTTNGVGLIYNPTIFGKPGFGEVGIWFSYWPIGNKLAVGDEVNVSIFGMGGVRVLECRASLVYTDDDDDGDDADDVAKEGLENSTIDLSRFRLSTGASYLCRRDNYRLMEVGALKTRGWLSILVGDNIDDREVQGWKLNGRP